MPDIPGFHVEAKLHGFRRTADGVVVSFVLHPAEVPSALALDPLGTIYQLGLCAIGDDGQPTEPPSQRQPTVQRAEAAAERPGVEPSSPSARARASELGKERYRAKTPMEQARTRAALLPDDERFRAWVCEQDPRFWRGNGGVSEERAAQYIREHCCEGGSRALIAEDPEAYRKFLALETMFKIAVGEIAEPR